MGGHCWKFPLLPKEPREEPRASFPPWHFKSCTLGLLRRFFSPSPEQKNIPGNRKLGILISHGEGTLLFLTPSSGLSRFLQESHFTHTHGATTKSHLQHVLLPFSFGLGVRIIRLSNSSEFLPSSVPAPPEGTANADYFDIPLNYAQELA